MDGQERDKAVRQNLLERLLDAIKQCQTHFGARQEVATESDLRVVALCCEWEAVLCHGIKKSRTKLISSRGFGKSDSSPMSFLWPVIRQFLSDEEQQRFLNMKSITTNLGRGRAWLRAAINERTLENYLHSMLASGSILSSHYDPNAFLMDAEKGSMLPVMAAGLNSILFSLSTDSEVLNSLVQDADTPSIVPAVGSSVSQPSLGPVDGPTHLSVADRLSVVQNGSDDQVVAVSNKKSKKRKKKASTSPAPSSGDASPHFDVHSHLTTSHSANLPVEPYETEPSFSQTIHQAAERPLVNITETQPRDMLALASYDSHPNSELGELGEGADSPNLQTSSRASSPSVQSVDSAADDTNISSLSLFVAPTDSQLAIEATSRVLAMSSPVHQTGEVTFNKSKRHSRSNSGDLREALVLLARGKEEAESTIIELQQKLDERELRCMELERELVVAQTEVQQVRESHIQQQQALERENDLLREQLKRHVALVQSHQHQHHSSTTDQESRENKVQRSELQEKLTAMAEMYGELMEFNDRLHKQMNKKDAVIIRLGQTITMAQIEMPVPTNQLPLEALQPRKLVEVWIPSVIKKGRGPDTHHAYQVYVKLGGDEWNVYRRFAEFLEFHRQICVHLPEIGEFNFPPKKAINNKSAQVVEERRQRLQDYLRFVLEACSKPTAKRKRNKGEFKPIISATMTKDAFLQTFPFFQDTATVQQQNVVAKKVAPSYSGL